MWSTSGFCVKHCVLARYLFKTIMASSALEEHRIWALVTYDRGDTFNLEESRHYRRVQLAYIDVEPYYPSALETFEGADKNFECSEGARTHKSLESKLGEYVRIYKKPVPARETLKLLSGGRTQSHYRMKHSAAYTSCLVCTNCLESTNLQRQRNRLTKVYREVPVICKNASACLWMRSTLQIQLLLMTLSNIIKQD